MVEAPRWLGVIFVFDFDLLRLVVAGADLAESVVLGVGFDFIGDGVEGHACYETRRGRKVNAAAKKSCGREAIGRPQCLKSTGLRVRIASPAPPSSTS